MIKPIRTLAGLAQAKARLAELLQINSTGNHDDEIEVLSTLIEKFEHTLRVEAPSPVAALKFRMEEMGLTPRQLEPFIGSRARVSEVLSGKRQLSIDMIRSLHEGLGIPYESLISKRSGESPKRVSNHAIHRLNSFGFNLARDEIASFVRTVETPMPPAVALHRRTRTQRAASKTDQAALLLWQAAVLRKSKESSTPTPFDRTVLAMDELRKIARLSRKTNGPILALDALAHLGILAVVLPPLPGTFLDGAAMVDSEGTPVIGLTLRHDRVDSFWYTLFHELAHVARHYELLLDRGAAFIDDMEIQSGDSLEREADELARESLIPATILSGLPWNESTTQDDIIALANRARVHVAIAAGRWQRDRQNYKRFARLVERGTVRSMFRVSAVP